MQRNGYTIIELTVVVVVIGILAAIVIVSYSSFINRANDTAVQSDLEAATALFESYRLDSSHASEFPRDTTALSTLGIKASKKSYQTTLSANFIYCISGDYQAYNLVARSKSNNFFMITENGLKPYTLTATDFTVAALCPLLGKTYVSSGMSAPNTWQAWVGNS